MRSETEVKIILGMPGMSRKEYVFFLVGVPDTVMSVIAISLLPMLVWGVSALPVMLGVAMGVVMTVWKTSVWYQIAEAMGDDIG